MGILDTIIDSKHTDLVHEFDPLLTVGKILENLKERDRIILKKRYGLQGENLETLETVGKQLELTRERVRQIEKSLLKQLKGHVKTLEHFQKNEVLLKNTISDHGGIMAEVRLLEHLGIKAIEEANAVRFILNLIQEINSIRNEGHLKDSWTTLEYSPKLLKSFVEEAKKILEATHSPHQADVFLKKFKNSALFKELEPPLTDKIVLNFLHSSREIRKNPFGEFGLSHWNEISPRDVGDKAYLVMKHHGKPEHYTAITSLINKHNIDSRKAFKETVHNELIKDARFILVGRGIYALSEWGYKAGMVSDVISDVLKLSPEPMPRDVIVEEVLKHRLVKKNTVLVGLSNKKLFKKVGKNLYTLFGR